MSSYVSFFISSKKMWVRKAILPSVGSCPEYPNLENNLILGSLEGFKVNLTSCFLPVAKSCQDSFNIPALKIGRWRKKSIIVVINCIEMDLIRVVISLHENHITWWLFLKLAIIYSKLKKNIGPNLPVLLAFLSLFWNLATF